MHPRRARALVVLAAFIASAACGGKVTGDPAPRPGASDGGDSSPPSSSGSDPGFGVCPADAPNLGDPCVMPNQGCVYLYGNGGCVAFVCDGSDHWVSSNEGC
jgi:hypothetical protein